MNENPNIITWASRTTRQLRTIGVTRVVLTHGAREREAGQISILFEDGPYHYRMRLPRSPDDRRFEGLCQKSDRVSEQFIQAIPVRFVLLDSLESDALILGLIPWVDDSQQEFDWMGRFTNVQRVIWTEQKGKGLQEE